MHVSTKIGPKHNMYYPTLILISIVLNGTAHYLQLLLIRCPYHISIHFQKYGLKVSPIDCVNFKFLKYEICRRASASESCWNSIWKRSRKKVSHGHLSLKSFSRQYLRWPHDHEHRHGDLAQSQSPGKV